MQKVSFLLLLVLVMIDIDAQPLLYGVGGYGNGSIARYDGVDDSLSVEFNFKNKGVFPGPMMRAKNGLLYGTTADGGAYGYGVLFSYDPVSKTYFVLRSFHKSQGPGRKGKLCEAPNGMLFGYSQGTGFEEEDHGLVFSYNPQSNALAVIHEFTASEFEYGSRIGSMVLANDGNLYGTTEHTIFRVNTATSAYATVFTEPNRAIFFGINLTAASNGLLYGTTLNEEAGYIRQIFSFNTATNTHTYVYERYDASFPILQSQGLTEANERLYGSTELGIYSYDLKEKTVQYHVSFDPAFFTNLKGFTRGLDGNLYSTGMIRSSENYGDDDNDKGFVYRFNPTANTGSIIKNFGEYSGLSEELVQLPNGSWYSTFSSPNWSLGTIVTMDYAFSPVDLYRFRQNPGANSSGPLLDNGDGILIGTAFEGGTYNKGVLYSFNLQTKQQQVLKNFTGGDGDRPTGGLCRGKDGKLYGVTQVGGIKGYGTLFSFDVPTSSYTLIKSFDVTTGGYPGRLVIDANGVLYGMTQAVDENAGSVHSYLYSYDPAKNTFTTLSSNDFFPEQLAIGKDGKIYIHIPGDGLVFSYDPGTKSKHKYTIPSTLNIGHLSQAGLHQAPDGLFYGITRIGTTNNDGTLFSFDPINEKLKMLFAFSRSGSTGYRGGSTLMTGSDGLLYGYTTEGGANNMGTLFTYDRKLGRISKVKDFDERNAIRSTLTELNLLPSISITDAKVYESDGEAVLTVSLSKPSIYNIVVGFQMKAGTAISWGTNPDYTATKGKLIFSAGMLTANIIVPILKDQVGEPQEWFNVLLTNLSPTRASIGDSMSIIAITDGTRVSTAFNQAGSTEFVGNENKPKTESALSLTVLPNPSRSSFSFDLITIGNKPAQFRIYDQLGRILESRSNLRTGRLNGIGNTFMPGVYYAEVKQGSEKKVVKLIKE